ncbi:MAG TPA: trehalose-phosphatase [Rhizomicrobium sp.]|jgi:trehalose 6-phosphate phosphatase|nr:trehalose-phosphatase [Rhizomicrobium sp.]
MTSALQHLPVEPLLPSLDLMRDALFLDIDGTMIDIAPTPEAVVVPESLKLSLSRLREALGGALALISGRTLGAIDELFAPLKFTAAADHAAEIRLQPAGRVKHCAAPLSSAEKAAFAPVVKLDPRLRIEDKVYTLAVHYRLAPELGDTVIAAMRDTAAELHESLRVLCGKAVVEVKRHGFNKGTGLREIMLHPPFAGRRPIFLGDDVTDEDALAVLPEFSGLGISVGRLLPGATRQISSPAEVRLWLAQLVAGGI